MAKALILALGLVLFISAVSALTVPDYLCRFLLQQLTHISALITAQVLLKTKLTTMHGQALSEMLLRTRITMVLEKMPLKIRQVLRPGTIDGGTWSRTETWEAPRTRRPSATGSTSEKTDKENPGTKLVPQLDLYDPISSSTLISSSKIKFWHLTKYPVIFYFRKFFPMN
jgi:hypothetical protein